MPPAPTAANTPFAPAHPTLGHGPHHPSPTLAPPTLADAEAGGLTLLGAGARLKGELVLTAPARILGRVEGSITSSERLEIGPGAVCEAALDAPHIVIDGTVHGQVLARERLELNATGVIQGDVTAARLIAAEGSTLCGRCQVGSGAVRSGSEATGGVAYPVQALTTPAAPVRSVVAPVNSEVGVKPTARPSPSELESALSGLESKLAGFARTRAGAGAV